MQNLPNGVIKVVSGRDSVAKLVCQNDEFASSLENTTAFARLAKDSSTEGSGKFSRLTDMFSFVKSMQILTL
jgi:hypothetical protein